MKTIQVAPIKPTVTFDTLEKIDVRVGTIEIVEDVQGSDKLVRLIVDFGDHKRKILVGMKQERQIQEKSKASRLCLSSILHLRK